MRRSAAIALAVAGCAFVVAALPYWNAAALIVRAADIPGPIGRVAGWEARAVSDSLDRVPVGDGSLRVRIFRPSGHARRGVLLVTGVHPDGIDEPRLVDLARDLAGTGVNVVTPEIIDLKEFRLTASVTNAIESTALWLLQRDDLSGGAKVGIIGVSFSGGLSIVAAGRPSLRDRVAFVLSLGGHGNLPRVLTYLCTGIEPSVPGYPDTRRPPHDYALAIVLHQAAPLAVPADQVTVLRRGIEDFLLASAMARSDRPRAQSMTDTVKTFQRTLPEPSATLLKYVVDRDVVSLGKRLVPFLGDLGQDPALSPDRSPPPAAPVYLLHGRDDSVIPPVESFFLARDLERMTKVLRLESGFLSHVDVAEPPSLLEAWDMIRFWKAALGEMS